MLQRFRQLLTVLSVLRLNECWYFFLFILHFVHLTIRKVDLMFLESHGHENAEENIFFLLGEAFILFSL